MWLHVVLAALTHDIGYLRGICQADTEHRFRGRRKGRHDRVAARRLRRCLSRPTMSTAPRSRARTLRLQPSRRCRPAGTQHRADALPGAGRRRPRGTDTEAAFVRAADLIGQLGDPLYPRKLNALFHEFEEIGSTMLGYVTPATWRTTIRVLLVQGRTVPRRGRPCAQHDGGRPDVVGEPLLPCLRDRARPPGDGAQPGTCAGQQGPSCGTSRPPHRGTADRWAGTAPVAKRSQLQRPDFREERQ